MNYGSSQHPEIIQTFRQGGIISAFQLINLCNRRSFPQPFLHLKQCGLLTHGIKLNPAISKVPDPAIQAQHSCLSGGAFSKEHPLNKATYITMHRHHFAVPKQKRAPRKGPFDAYQRTPFCSFFTLRCRSHRFLQQHQQPKLRGSWHELRPWRLHHQKDCDRPRIPGQDRSGQDP